MIHVSNTWQFYASAVTGESFMNFTTYTYAKCVMSESINLTLTPITILHINLCINNISLILEFKKLIIYKYCIAR